MIFIAIKIFIITIIIIIVATFTLFPLVGKNSNGKNTKKSLKLVQFYSSRSFQSYSLHCRKSPLTSLNSEQIFFANKYLYYNIYNFLLPSACRGSEEEPRLFISRDVHF